VRVGRDSTIELNASDGKFLQRLAVAETHDR